MKNYFIECLQQYKEHELDQYVSLGEKPEHKRFGPNFQQALAWKRLEAGTHNQDGITWIKHECAERHHELKYGAGYSESHARAQSHFFIRPNLITKKLTKHEVKVQFKVIQVFII